MKKLLLSFINFYQIVISTAFGGRAACRFVPTCSEYTKQAIEKHGAIRGGFLGFKRICRCHPLGGRGLDTVP